MFRFLQKFNANIEHLIDTSENIHGFLDKLLEESERFKGHANQVDDIQTKCIVEFQNAYEVYPIL